MITCTADSSRTCPPIISLRLRFGYVPNLCGAIKYVRHPQKELPQGPADVHDIQAIACDYDHTTDERRDTSSRLGYLRCNLMGKWYETEDLLSGSFASFHPWSSCPLTPPYPEAMRRSRY